MHEPWQWFLAWFAVELLKTLQMHLLGRKVTKTLMPPPMPSAAGAYCRNCGSLTQTRSLTNGLCAHCSVVEPTRRR